MPTVGMLLLAGPFLLELVPVSPRLWGWRTERGEWWLVEAASA